MIGTSRIITPAEFDWAWFGTLKAEKNAQRNKACKTPQKYLDITTAFDIETTGLPEIAQSIMYVWQWQIGPETTVMGRTWDELRAFISELLKHIPEGLTLCVAVHNLMYEFQFLRTIYNFKSDEVFAVKSRRILKCTMYNKKLEFRCSYLHCNMSLDKFLEEMGVEHKKESGKKYDYNKRRFPWTPLTDFEIRYCQHDVLGLVEAIEIEKKRDGDNWQTLPLTSTGYVRRDVKRSMRSYNADAISAMQPDINQYRLLRDAFRGGDTHANRYYVDHIIEDVSSADRSSSYPDVICNRVFPMSKFTNVENPTIDKIRYHIGKGHAVCAKIGLWDVSLTDETDGFPYIPRAMCSKIVNGVYDNGRVLCADYLEISITDIDYKIISERYCWAHIKGIECMWATYGPLPLPIILCAIQYYKNKTRLKGVTSDDGSAEYLYSRSKALLNAIYGMMAQDPVKMDILFREYDGTDETFIPFYTDWKEPEEKLTKYEKRAFLVYQWGVWTTAWARYELYCGVRNVVNQGGTPLYCDTDSVKYIGEVDWTEYNAARIKASTKSGAHATDANGTEHYMGVFEQETGYREFITQGAKKYAYRYPDGKLGITVAGVAKKEGAVELEAHGGLTAFRDGFIFRDAGGLETVYNDTTRKTIVVDGGSVEVGPNIYLRPSTYKMGKTDDYIRILETPGLFDKMRQRTL